MDLTIRTERTVLTEDRTWLHDGDHHVQQSITLDVSEFAPKADYYPSDFLPSGLVLGKITASGLYGPYDNVETNGTEVAAGILFSSVVINADLADVSGAMLIHGFIIVANLIDQGALTDGGWDAAAATDLAGQIVAV